MQRKYSQEKLNIFENLYIKETEKQIKKLQEELAKAKEDAALALTQAETEKQKLVKNITPKAISTQSRNKSNQKIAKKRNKRKKKRER